LLKIYKKDPFVSWNICCMYPSFSLINIVLLTIKGKLLSLKNTIKSQSAFKSIVISILIFFFWRKKKQPQFHRRFPVLLFWDSTRNFISTPIRYPNNVHVCKKHSKTWNFASDFVMKKHFMSMTFCEILKCSWCQQFQFGITNYL